MTFDPLPIVIYQEQRQEQHADAVDAMLDRMHRAYTVELHSERDALILGLEVLRDSIAPVVNAPRRGRARVSTKARRRAVAAIDHVIAQARQTKVSF